jgi:hypothetical protein
VLRNMLEEASVKHNFRNIKISGVNQETARVFIRFLYSSWYIVSSSLYVISGTELACTGNT